MDIISLLNTLMECHVENGGDARVQERFANGDCDRSMPQHMGRKDGRHRTGANFLAWQSGHYD